MTLPTASKPTVFVVQRRLLPNTGFAVFTALDRSLMDLVRVSCTAYKTPSELVSELNTLWESLPGGGCGFSTADYDGVLFVRDEEDDDD